jgi:hypothetical protein
VSWSGFAFESVCLKHSRPIQKALGIADVLSQESTWRYQPPRGSREKGAQIGLLFDRQDRTINLCEMKFAGDPFVIVKEYTEELDNRVKVFQRETGRRKPSSSP